MSNTQIQYAGEFLLEEAKILTVSGTMLDIKEIINEINIYEDIFSNAISGDIVITDTTNLVYNAPIVGEEQLILRLKTPQKSTDDSGEINYTKNPLIIYKIDSTMKATEYGKTVMFSFTSQEILKDRRMRISKSFKGKPNDIVEKILMDGRYLDTYKNVWLQSVSNSYKFVIPNMHPFDAINMIAKRTNSANHNGAPTFLFYETTKGFHFRSLDNLCSEPESKMTYNETIPNSDEIVNVARSLQNIERMEINANKDTLQNTAIGMYSGTLKVHDIYNKTIRQHIYNYLDEFPLDTHVNDVLGQGNFPLISQATDDKEKRMSDYTDTVLHVSSTTDGRLYSENGRYPYQSDNIENWLLRRQSRFSQFDNAIKITMQVPGVTHLQVGDVITVNVLNKSTLSDEKFDRYYSGRYIINKLRHNFKIGGESKHTIYMEVSRDNLSKAIPAVGIASENTAAKRTIRV